MRNIKGFAACKVNVVFTIFICISADGTAADRELTAGEKDTAAVNSIILADFTAVHDERRVTINIYTAAVEHRAGCAAVFGNETAVHGETSSRMDIHTAAVSKRFVPADRSAFQDKVPAGFNDNAAAVFPGFFITAGFSACDSTAVFRIFKRKGPADSDDIADTRTRDRTAVQIQREFFPG